MGPEAPMTSDLHIDHVAVAVRSVDAAADRLCSLLGYHRSTSKVTNTRQKVTVLFLSKSGSLDLKLIEPSGQDSPLWDFVRKGGGLLIFSGDKMQPESYNQKLAPLMPAELREKKAGAEATAEKIWPPCNGASKLARVRLGKSDTSVDSFQAWSTQPTVRSAATHRACGPLRLRRSRP